HDAAPARDHLWAEGPQDQEWRGDIDLECALPRVRRHVDQTVARIDAGIVDDAIGHTVDRERRGDGALDLWLLAEVDLDEGGFAVLRSDLADGLLAELGVDIPHRHLRPASGEASRKGAAEAAAASGHHDHVARYDAVACDAVVHGGAPIWFLARIS